MNVRKTKRGKWAYDFRFEGRRYIRVVGDSKEQAANAAAVHKKRLIDERHGLLSPIDDIRFDELLEKYFALVASKKRAWRRIRLSIDHLKRHFRGKRVSEITTLGIDEYKDKRLEKVCGPTVNRELATLSHIFTMAIRWRHAVRNPAKGIDRYRESDPVERILTKDEEGRLLAAARPRLRAILIIALNTGMRRNEILSLRWKNVDLRNRRIMLEATNTKGGKKSRLIPLNAQAVKTLQQMPRTHELMFYNKRTRRYIADVKTAFLAACAKAGIRGLRFHDLRHTFATRLVGAGVDLVTISKLLGHARISTTMRYAHSPEESQRHAVEKLDESPENLESETESDQFKAPVPRRLNYSYPYYLEAKK